MLDYGNPVLIALEGLDACGKGTQTELLAAALGASSLKFPTYEVPSGQVIRRVFANPHPDPEVAAYSLQALQTINRLEMCNQLWARLSEGPLVLDRYTASAYAYGLADGLTLEWLRSIEPGSIPQPTVQVYIDIPVEESFRRRPKRDDAYESDYRRLSRVRDAYLELFDDPPQTIACSGEPTAWLIIDGRGTIDQVHRRVMDCVPDIVLTR